MTLGDRLVVLDADSAMLQFAKITSAEYRAMGITTALGPQIDLATEPRWLRVDGTFGENVNLATTIPSAPGYIGTFDAPGIAVLTAYGVDQATAAGYTLVLHVALWVPITALGAYYLAREGIKWSDTLFKRLRVQTAQLEQRLLPHGVDEGPSGAQEVRAREHPGGPPVLADNQEARDVALAHQAIDLGDRVVSGDRVDGPGHVVRDRPIEEGRGDACWRRVVRRPAAGCAHVPWL